MPNRERNRSPAETVAGNYDLLIEILIRLPVRSLLRFKSVSKLWLSLITNPNFTRRLKPNPKHSGLFLQCISSNKCTDIDFVPLLDDENLPFRSITSAIHSWKSGRQIIHSCNGLFLCSSFRGLNNSSLYYYIYNPSTGRFTTLPNPNTGGEFRVNGRFAVASINLACDPLKSPHYKVVCIYHSRSFPLHFEIVIYSSETGLWMCSAIRFPMSEIFSGVVFCNGSLHWIPGGHDLLLYFNVEEELLATTPLPPILDGWEDERRISYFGESRGHLHLIEIYSTPTTHFNVYEMERDYSGWFIKYRVDLDQVAEAFPEMIAHYLPPSNLRYYRFVILGLIQEYDNKESFLVVYIPGKAIRYNFHDKSFKELCDFPPSHHACTLHISTGSLKFSGWFYAFAYTESLASV